MIACVSPASVYVEETLSTLNYATRAMNIKNRPILQVDSTEHMILALRQELQIHKMQNEYLRDQFSRIKGGKPPSLVDFANTYNQQPGVNPAVQELQFEFNKLTEDNANVRQMLEASERSYHQVMMDNQSLRTKLESLEEAFVGGVKGEDGKVSTEYAISSLLNENTNLKRVLSSLQQEQATTQFRFEEASTPVPMNLDLAQMKEVNVQLQNRVEQLQQRERELLQFLQNVQRSRPRSKTETLSR